MSLLTMVKAVCRKVGINAPTTAFANTDPQIIQIMELAQIEGVELARRHPWPKLTKEKTFTGTAAAVQTSAFPSDFDRFVDESFFNRTKKRPVNGPISAADWQYVQAMTATTLTESYRQRGTDILITPTPAGTETYAYEYISNQWCEASGGTDQSAWAADTDLGILSETIMKLGITWRLLEQKRFDYGESFRAYEIAVSEEFGRQGGRRSISMASKRSMSPRAPFTPEGSWSL